MKKLIIFGTEDFAQIAYRYFTGQREYEVVAFTVDRDYISSPDLLGLPVVAFEDIEDHYATKGHEIYVAVVYGDMNRLRQRKCAEAKEKGYALASYISPHAFVEENVTLGEHVFIFEDNVVQHESSIGDNCVLWSGNHIGHHSAVGNNVFISSHVVVSGWCSIGDNCFIGVNSTLANNTRIGKESWVSHGSTINGIVPEHSLVKSLASSVIPLNEDALSRALERARK